MVTKTATTTQCYAEYKLSRLNAAQSKGVAGRDTTKPFIEGLKPRDSRKDVVVKFRFFDKTEIEIDGETLRGEAKNYSGWYYPNARVMTYENFKNGEDNKSGKWSVSGADWKDIDRSKELMVAVVDSNKTAYYLGKNDSVLKSVVEVPMRT